MVRRNVHSWSFSHPEDDPADILPIDTLERSFADAEATEIHTIQGSMLVKRDPETINAYHPLSIRSSGHRLNAK